MATVKRKILRHKRLRLDASWFLLEYLEYPNKEQVEAYIAVQTIIIAHLKKVKNTNLNNPSA